jgi:outer membrane protein
MKSIAFTLTSLAMATLSIGAHAQASTSSPSPWSIGVGAVHMKFHPSANVSLAGNPVPGGEVMVGSDTVLGVEIGYAVTPNWTARLDIGSPVETDFSGAGTLGLLGKLGSVKGGPAILTMTYSPGMLGPIRPFFGGGLTYMKVFSTKDGAVQNLKVDDALGTALTIGADWPLSDGYSIGFSVQKLFLKVKATGTAGGAPVRADVKLDPVVTFLSLRKQF